MCVRKNNIRTPKTRGGGRSPKGIFISKWAYLDSKLINHHVTFQPGSVKKSALERCINYGKIHPLPGPEVYPLKSTFHPSKLAKKLNISSLDQNW